MVNKSKGKANVISKKKISSHMKALLAHRYIGNNNNNNNNNNIPVPNNMENNENNNNNETNEGRLLPNVGRFNVRNMVEGRANLESGSSILDMPVSFNDNVHIDPIQNLDKLNNIDNLINLDNFLDDNFESDNFESDSHILDTPANDPASSNAMSIDSNLPIPTNNSNLSYIPIYRCKQMQLLQTSSAGLPTWRRFRGLTPGPPLLSQVPPQLSKTVARL